MPGKGVRNTTKAGGSSYSQLVEATTLCLQAETTGTEVAVKARRPNWIPLEEAELVTAILENHLVLFGNFSSTITQKKKDETWKAVATRVNSISGHFRTEAQMKEKYRDLKSRTKKKAVAELRRIQKTGGGEKEDDDPLSTLEEKITSLKAMEISVVKFYGKTWLFGIETGFDSSELPFEPPLTDLPAQDESLLALPEPDLPVQSQYTQSTKPKRALTTKEAARAKISSEMLGTQHELLQTIKSIDDSLKELVSMKRKKYETLGYL